MRSVRAKCAETTAAGSVTLSPPKTPQSTARALKKVGQGLGTIAFLFIPTWRGITGGIMQSASLSRRNFFRLCTGTFGGLTLLRKDQPRFQVGLDVGCSKIVIAVVEHRSGFRPRLLSANAVPSHSVTHHGITDESTLTHCLGHALQLAERSSDVMIREVHVSIVGTSIGPDLLRQNQPDSMGRAELAFQADESGLLIPLNPARRISQPLIEGAACRISAITRCLASHGVKIAQNILAPSATAKAILNAQQQRGALVIDIGSGTTDYVVIMKGKIIAMDYLTRGTDKMQFEGISAMQSNFRLIRGRLEKQGIDIAKLHAGVQLVGGGTLIDGMLEAARESLGRNTHLAELIRIPSATEHSPAVATALGLALWQNPGKHNA